MREGAGVCEAGVAGPTRWQIRARTAIIVAGCLLVLLLALGVVPVWREQGDYCMYCMARRTTTSVFGLHTGTRIQETHLHRYWLRHVDPGHRHTWAFMWSHTYSPRFGPTEFADGYAPPFLLRRDGLFVELLHAVPDRESRLRVSRKLWAFDPHRLDSAEIHLRERRLAKLDKLHDARPNRIDWPAVIRKLGLL